MTDLKPDDLDEIDRLVTAIECEFEEHFNPESCPGLLAAFAETHGFIAGYKARMKREEDAGYALFKEERKEK